MECVHRTSNRTLAQLLRSALESEGLPAIVAGEHLTPLQGETPAGVAAEYRVCLVDDEQLPRATRLVKQWLERPSGSGAIAWVCPSCGERHEPQFGTCWKCGSDESGA